MKTINHEYYVSPEVAKLLKEAGFDWKCQYYIHAYTQEIIDSIKTHKKSYRNEDVDFSAPTLEVAQRWLREMKEIYVYAFPMATCITKNSNEFAVSIYNGSKTYTMKCYSTYEEAQEAGIKKALELILEKGK